MCSTRNRTITAPDHWWIDLINQPKFTCRYTTIACRYTTIASKCNNTVLRCKDTVLFFQLEYHLEYHLQYIEFPSVLPTNHKETPLLGYTDNRSFGRTIKEMWTDMSSSNKLRHHHFCEAIPPSLKSWKMVLSLSCKPSHQKLLICYRKLRVNQDAQKSW